MPIKKREPLVRELTLKEKLDAIWNGPIVFGCNLVSWNTKGTGYKRFDEYNLFYTRGRSTGPVKKKVR